MLAGFESMEHRVYHSQVDHAFTATRQRLVVLAQPAILAKPGKGPFHNPTPGQHNETMRPATLDNLDYSPEHHPSPIHEGPGISSINPYPFQPPEPHAQFLQHKPPAIPILDVSRVHHHDQNQPESVDKQVSFTPRKPLSRIVTAVPPFSAVLTLWLSKIAALGLGLRPFLRRTCSRRRS